MILALCAIAISPLNLHRSDSWNATLSLHFVDQAQEIDQTHVEGILSEVVQETPLKVKVTRQLIETQIDGNRIPALKGLKPDTYAETLGPTGALLETTRVETPVQARLARLYRVVLPPDRLSRPWDVTLPGTDDRGIPPATVRYAVTGRVQHGPRSFTKIKFHLEESGGPAPIAEDGTAEIDDLTGVLFELRAKATNVLLPGGTDRTSVEIIYCLSALPKR